jgi:hypothetical protein
VYFKKAEDLDSHITVTASEICQLRPGFAPEGLSAEQERRLRSRKKSGRDQSDDDRWRDMYKLLFPYEEVLSPCQLPVFPLPLLKD